MQKSLLGMITASMLLAAAPPMAIAQSKAAVEAKLAAPVSEPRKVIIDGRLGRCQDDVCLGQEQGDSQPLKRECARVAKVVGPIVAYRNGQRELTEADLATCNASRA